MPAIGGPLVPARLPAYAGPFEQHVYRVGVARAQVDRLTRTLASVPVRKPVMGEIEVSSGFGMRIDPFIRAPAMHTGMDFRGDTGDPVRATADGNVTVAGWQGGYGKMVEIDHGNGLTTRYAHLSDDQRQGRAAGARRPHRRQDRIDRTLDRTASALRDARERRRRRSAEIPARRTCGWAARTSDARSSAANGSAAVLRLAASSPCPSWSPTRSGAYLARTAGSSCLVAAVGHACARCRPCRGAGIPR